MLGKSLEIPGSLCSDEEASAHAATEGADLESGRHRQRLEVRCRARRFLHRLGVPRNQNFSMPSEQHP